MHDYVRFDTWLGLNLKTKNIYIFYKEYYYIITKVLVCVTFVLYK